MSRPYQVVVFGASGFTGRLVAEYLAAHYAADHEQPDRRLRWAMAGRSSAKLERVRSEIGAEGIGLIVADSHDRESLDAMCAQAEVVCTTVGPYAKYGVELVAACVVNGTDYCDLSGEVPFMRRTIEAHHAKAHADGTRIVHSCGFDSVPSDVGLLFLQREAEARLGRFCESVEMVVAGAKGSFSGGTFASLFNVLRERRERPGVADILDDPYALNAPAPPGNCPAPDLKRAKYSETFGVTVAPFVMASINTRIVRRSHALAGFPYGRDFCYSEAMATGRGALASLSAKLMATGINAVERGGLVSKLAQKLTPDPGEGPGRDERESGYFKLRFFGKTGDGQHIRTELRGKRDPGYGATSRMLAESAIALATTRGQGRTGGVLTPALAIGEELLTRLPDRADVTMRVVE